MENKYLILLIIGGIVFLAVGFVAGIVVQKQTSVQQFEKLEKMTNLKPLLDTAGTITRFTASGRVSDVSDKTITIISGAKSLKIPVSKNAQFFAFVRLETGTGSLQRKDSDFSEIEVGSSVNIDIGILPNGSFEGVSVTIMPSPVTK